MKYGTEYWFVDITRKPVIDKCTWVDCPNDQHRLEHGNHFQTKLAAQLFLQHLKEFRHAYQT